MADSMDLVKQAFDSGNYFRCPHSQTASFLGYYVKGHEPEMVLYNELVEMFGVYDLIIACNECVRNTPLKIQAAAFAKAQREQEEAERAEALQKAKEAGLKYYCEICDEYTNDGGIMFECSNCGSEFSKDGNDGSHRCPDCNKFAGRSDEKACLNCYEKLEEVE